MKRLFIFIFSSHINADKSFSTSPLARESKLLKGNCFVKKKIYVPHNNKINNIVHFLAFKKQG